MATSFKRAVSILSFSFFPFLAAAADAAANSGGLLVRYRSTEKAMTSSPMGEDVVRVETEEPQADLESLRNDPDVAHAEPDYAIEPAALPDDPYLQEPGYNYETSRIVEAWDIVQDCSGVIVAVLDGGIDVNHPDLRDNLWTNEEEIPDNGVDDDENGYVDDVHGFDFNGLDGDVDDGFGHGTAVAGIIGAVGNNNIGLSGVCWSVQILPLKIFGDREDEGGNLSSALEAVDYAIDHGARVLNLSWTLLGEGESLFLKESIRKAGEAGVLVVAAAGNGGNDLASHPVYPAAYDTPNLITVGAYGFEGERPDFTNYGDGIVDIAAPGLKVITTTVNSGYFFFSGTSAAAPHVSGAAALLLSQNPGLEPEKVVSLLEGAAEADSGNLNVSQALAALETNDDVPQLEEETNAPSSSGGCGLMRPASEK